MPNPYIISSSNNPYFREDISSDEITDEPPDYEEICIQPNSIEIQKISGF